jgi:hypothetical protein
MLKKIIGGGAILGALALTLALSAGASATTTATTAQKFGPNYTPERHTAMTAAFESKDYAAWKKLMEANTRGGKRVLQVVTEQNFAKFSEMHQLMQDGKITEANAIRQELGLGQKNGQGQGKGNGQGRGMGQGQGMNRGNCPNLPVQSN